MDYADWSTTQRESALRDRNLAIPTNQTSQATALQNNEQSLNNLRMRRSRIQWGIARKVGVRTT